MMTANGEAKIIDFGIATQAFYTQHTYCPGTHPYIAPETTNSDYTTKVDIFR